MYKLIIVDDENFIREQLSQAIDWASMGFALTGSFQDGNDAWEFIKTNDVDVVLTDISMPFLSGIELSRLVHEQYPNIVVILLSGYKEFEYARQAIQQNVYNYLLKPTTYKDISDTFLQVKTKLDAQIEKDSALNDELLTLTRKQLFFDILIGALTEKEAIQLRLKSAELEIDLNNDPCCVVDIQLNDFEEYLHKDWMHGKDRFYAALLNFIQSNTPLANFLIISFNLNKAQIISIGNGISPTDLYQETSLFFSKAAESINEILRIKVEVDIGTVSTNILGLINYYTKNKATYTALDSQQLRSIASYIHAGNGEAAVNVIHSVFKVIIGDINAGQSLMLNLFTNLMDMLRESGKDPKELIPTNIETTLSFSEILNLSIATSIDVAAYFASNPSTYYSALIDKSIAYIKDHCAEGISLDDVAEYVSLSPVYFSRYFKQKVGEKFIDYLCRMRIEKASELLCNLENKVYEVCSLVGYISMPHFYKQFKLYTGFTPTEYRNNLSKAGDKSVKK
jgi:two-component system response regulator YesN